MRTPKLKRVARVMKRIVAPSPCKDGHSRFQHIVNGRNGERVQVCDRCGKAVGKALPGERRENFRAA